MATNTKVNGQKYYRLTKTINGKRKQFYGKTKQEAEDKYAEYLNCPCEDAPTEPSEPISATFGRLADTYVTEVLSVSQKYAHGTIERYKSVYRCHIRGKPITKKTMREITAYDIQRFYNGLDVSQATMKAVHKFMSAFYKWCVLCGHAPDVLNAVEIPRKKENTRHTEIIVWTDEEINAILHALDAPVSLSQRFRATFLVKVLIYTGMRISEALSLRYSDIKDNTIHVERQYYLGEIKPPKWGSIRQIPMHEELIKALEKHRAWQKEDMEKHGYTTEYIFTSSKGHLYCASSVRRMLVSMCSNIGIEYKHIHAYRSTFCTQMCRCGVPLEVTSKLMGHKNLDVTIAHYALVGNTEKQKAIEKLHF